jgi:D-beta-D-heptose 7-phosphate kinase/D-beta-D-heptose 1-phosphate adenosyltransferase
MKSGESFECVCPDKRILVVGDIMLDRYVYGRVKRISPEAPAMVLAADIEDQMPGGAANVAVNIATLGAACTLVGLVGEDKEAELLQAALAAWDRITASFVRDKARRTTLKNRFVSTLHHTHLLRVDWETTDVPPPEIASEIRDRARAEMAGCGVLVLSDYGKGTLSDCTIQDLIGMARDRGMVVLVDPKGTQFERYRGATVITPNLSELGAAIGREVPQDDGEVEAAAQALSRRTGIADVLVKRHASGVHLVRSGKTDLRLPALARSVNDVSGAGDTILATLAVAISTGSENRQAVRWANAAAAVVVSKQGTTAPTRREVDELLHGEARRPPTRKVSPDLEELVRRVASWRQAGLSVGLTNGCFDLLHAGHVDLLAQASARVDHLIVAINSDASIRAIKGPNRPVIEADARVLMIAALETVSAVIVFDAPTPLHVIEAVQPNCLFKGSDYKIDDVVGRTSVEAHGGQVVLIERRPDISTTAIIRRIIASA